MGATIELAWLKNVIVPYLLGQTINRKLLTQKTTAIGYTLRVTKYQTEWQRGQQKDENITH